MAGKQKNKLKVTTAWTLACLVVLFAALCLWLYTGDITKAKSSVFKALPFPMASVGGIFVPTNEYISRYQEARKIFPGTDPISLKDGTYAQLIAEEKLRQLALEHGVRATQKEIDEEYQRRAAAADLEGKKNFEELLAGFGLSRSSYQLKSIKPDILMANLQIWYNSNRQLNQAVYQQADNLLKRIRDGEDMGVLAKSFSQDEGSKATGGDTGFAEITELLPELREAATEAKTGEPKIIAARTGVLVLRKEEESAGRVRLRQIFLEAPNFQNWYKQETDKIKTKRFINPENIY